MAHWIDTMEALRDSKADDHFVPKAGLAGREGKEV
jgi:hypothetical protein